MEELVIQLGRLGKDTFFDEACEHLGIECTVAATKERYEDIAYEEERLYQDCVDRVYEILQQDLRKWWD
jgi:hypothetical protein